MAFKEELEGGNGGEISIEQMWGQFKFGDAFSVRFGQILPPVGRFNINHDDDRWDIPRRTLVDRNVPVLPVKAAWTELGVGASSEAWTSASRVNCRIRRMWSTGQSWTSRSKRRSKPKRRARHPQAGELSSR